MVQTPFQSVACTFSVGMPSIWLISIVNLGRDYHCELIGYHAKKKPQVPNPSSNSSDFMAQHGPHEPVVLSRSFCAAGRTHSELEGGTFLPLSAVSLVGRQGPLISSQRNLQEGRKANNVLKFALPFLIS